MIQIQNYLSTGPFSITTGLKTIEKDGGKLTYGPVLNGTVVINGPKTTINFDKPYPLASKSIWGMRFATNVLTVDIEGLMVVASTSSGKKLRYELREIDE